MAQTFHSRRDSSLSCWCEVADDTVVVIKFQPVKAGNSVEGKTEMTLGLFKRLLTTQKVV